MNVKLQPGTGRSYGVDIERERLSVKGISVDGSQRAAGN